MANLITTTGPVEPEFTRLARNAYYSHRVWRHQLENRIIRTLAGLEWLMRVHKIGRTI